MDRRTAQATLAVSGVSALAGLSAGYVGWRLWPATVIHVPACIDTQDVGTASTSTAFGGPEAAPATETPKDHTGDVDASASSPAPSPVGVSESLPRETTPEWLAERLESGESLFVMDVRDQESWQDRRLSRGINIPLELINARILWLPREKSAPIVAYCQDGNRGAQAAAKLRSLGFTNVSHLAGGLNAWMKAGYPVSVFPS
jgi:rhodanese-related sulfurtransferase